MVIRGTDWRRRANGAGEGAIAAAKVSGHRKQALPRGQDQGLFLGHLKQLQESDAGES